MKNNLRKSTEKGLAGFFLFFTLLIIPGIAFVEALFLLDKSSTAVLVADATRNVTRIKTEVKANLNDRRFLANRFGKAFKKSNACGDFVAEIKEIMSLYQIKLEYVTWNAKGKMVFSNIDLEKQSLVNPELTGIKIRKVLSQADFTERLELIYSLSPLFGRQFNISAKLASQIFIDKNLFRYDVDASKSYCWLASDKNYTALIKISPKELGKRIELSEFVQKNSS